MWGMGRAAGLLVAGVLAACAYAPVRTDFDPEVPFPLFRTWSWADSSPARARELADASPFLERRLRRAVEQQLEAGGYTQASGDERVDFLVSVFVVGPSREESPWRSWAATRCAANPRIGVSFGYPFGISRRLPWYRYQEFYQRDPWGWACSYRLGFGYAWIPIYDQPGDRTPGTLVVDVLDPASRDLLWRGWAEGAFLDRAERQTQEEVIAIVKSVLDHFPPGPPVVR